MNDEDLRRAVGAGVRAALPGVRWLALFGSRARGDARHDSDVDVAVLACEPIAEERLRAVRGDLEIAVGRDVHLIDLRRVSTVLRSQVVADADVLFAAGDADSEQFLDFVLSDYARLNEERRDILRDVHERGSVLGG
ncbi:MAG: nucleotidyltransferase domain-containing protein [Trueperaceae bacterium]|nr:nucleotidyltransferase domain-containing protein [Trueperaceae bacterium]